MMKFLTTWKKQRPMSVGGLQRVSPGTKVTCTTLLANFMTYEA